MAKGKKTGGRDFVAGKSGNPNGRPKIPDDLKTIRNVASLNIGKSMYEISFAKESDLKRLLKDKEVSVIEKIFAKGLLESMRNGDLKKLHYFLERLIGRGSVISTESMSEGNFHSKLMEIIKERNKRHGEDAD